MPSSGEASTWRCQGNTFFPAHKTKLVLSWRSLSSAGISPSLLRGVGDPEPEWVFYAVIPVFRSSVWYSRVGQLALNDGSPSSVFRSHGSSQLNFSCISYSLLTWRDTLKRNSQDFPGGPVTKFLYYQCGGTRFDHWSRN